MKIAVLLYGHMRDFEDCVGSVRENLLERYDCDVFIHTWDETDHSTVTWHNRKSNILNVDSVMLEKIHSIYGPKEIKVEHQNTYEDEQIIVSDVIEKFKFSTAIPYFSFYSMNQANNLRKDYEQKNAVQYDLVLVTRPDIEMKKYLNIKKVFDQSKILGLDTKKCRFFAGKGLNSELGNALYLNEPNDLLFFALPEVIDKYISVNKKLDVDYMKQHCINIVSIYTAKEIEAGILPVPISYSLGFDWTFLGYRKQYYLKYRSMNNMKRRIASIISFMYEPIRKLECRYPFLIDENRPK